MQSDPLGLDGGLSPFIYSTGSPVVFVDPYGLIDVDPTKTIRNLLRPPKGTVHRGPTTCHTQVVGAILQGNLGELVLALAECPFEVSPAATKQLKDLCELQNSSLQTLLQGTGKLKDLRSNPNLRGVDIDSILRGNLQDLRGMNLKPEQMSPIKKALEQARDLSGRKGGGA